MSDDQLVFVKQMLIDSVKSARVLNGKSVWMKTGYTLVYYPYRTGRVVFTQPAGWLPPAQELQVKDFVEVTTPPTGRAAFRAGRRMRLSYSPSLVATASLPRRSRRWTARIPVGRATISFLPRSEDALSLATGGVAGGLRAHGEAGHERVTDDDGSGEPAAVRFQGPWQPHGEVRDHRPGEARHFSVDFSGNKATAVSSQ